MEAFTKQQKGSPSRDHFKWLHKQLLPKDAWAINSDLELVAKYPRPFIVARLDFKVKGDFISFAEAISYKQLIDLPFPHTVPVYIIETERNFKNDDEPTENHRFTVQHLLDCDYRPNPPTTKVETVAANLTWDGLKEWEMNLRSQRAQQMATWIQTRRVAAD